MDGELIISGHVIERYRERVVVDELRHSRTNKDIVDIVYNSFRKVSTPQKLSNQLDLLVYFNNPSTNEFFQYPDLNGGLVPMPFNLVIKR